MILNAPPHRRRPDEDSLDYTIKEDEDYFKFEYPDVHAVNPDNVIDNAQISVDENRA